MLKIVKSKEGREALNKIVYRNKEIPADVMDTAREIIRDVREKGDGALFAYTEKFDGYKPTTETVRVTQKEISDAVNTVDQKLLQALQKAAANIESFHENQLQKGYIKERNGRMLGQRVKPLKNVGVYVPGGTASYPSTVLMNVLPAKVAGGSARLHGDARKWRKAQSAAACSGLYLRRYGNF